MEETINYWGLSPASLVLLFVGLVILVFSVTVYLLGTLQHRRKRAMRRMRSVGNQRIDAHSPVGQELRELRFRLDPEIEAAAKQAQQQEKLG